MVTFRSGTGPRAFTSIAPPLTVPSSVRMSVLSAADRIARLLGEQPFTLFERGDFLVLAV